MDDVSRSDDLLASSTCTIHRLALSHFSCRSLEGQLRPYHVRQCAYHSWFCCLFSSGRDRYMMSLRDRAHGLFVHLSWGLTTAVDEGPPEFIRADQALLCARPNVRFVWVQRTRSWCAGRAVKYTDDPIVRSQLTIGVKDDRILKKIVV